MLMQGVTYMTNKEKAFLIVELMDLLDRWDKFREENKEELQAKKSVKTNYAEAIQDIIPEPEPAPQSVQTKSKSGKRVCTIKEATALVDGLSEYRIRQMCLSGEHPCFMAGKKYLINEEDLYKALNIKR